MKLSPVGLSRWSEHNSSFAALSSKNHLVFRGFILGGALLGTCAWAQTLPPYSVDFESAHGYTLGSLAAQDGWQVPAGSAVVTDAAAFAGTFSVGLQAGSANANITHSFAQMSGAVATWIDFYTRPTVTWTLGETTTLTADGSSVSLPRLDSAGQIVVFDGDGAGGGRWVVTGRSVPLNEGGQAMNWVRITIRQDYSTKKWDLYIDGQLALPDLGLRDSTKTFLAQFSLVSASIATAYFDFFHVGPTSPLFNDADNDGMDDTWESGHGLNPALHDRNSDLDSDGLSNIEEYALGTNPNNTSTKGDGIMDGWKVSHGLGPLADVAATDPGEVGRSVLQSFQQGLSPWPVPIVASGLRAWYRADAGVIRDGSNNVSQCTDVSGHGFHVIQIAQAEWRPTWVTAARFQLPAHGPYSLVIACCDHFP